MKPFILQLRCARSVGRPFLGSEIVSDFSTWYVPKGQFIICIIFLKSNLDLLEEGEI
jgi:hypothetical protein